MTWCVPGGRACSTESTEVQHTGGKTTRYKALQRTKRLLSEFSSGGAGNAPCRAFWRALWHSGRTDGGHRRADADLAHNRFGYNLAPRRRAWEDTEAAVGADGLAPGC